MAKKPPIRSMRAGADVLQIVLAKSSPRPEMTDSSDVKTQYAVRFANEMAEQIAVDLQPRFPGISAVTSRSAPSSGGKKQLDIGFATAKIGLALGISLKSVHIREMTTRKPKGMPSYKVPGRFTHNMKRNDEELRIEVHGYHQRQPYAVMVAVMFLPFESCTDGKGENSSFGSWVRSLWPATGRVEPKDDTFLFEKIYVALYEPDGSKMSFFDVQTPPPKNTIPREDGDLLGPDGIPRRLMSYEEFLGEVYGAYHRRNRNEFVWDDGEVELETGENTE